MMMGKMKKVDDTAMRAFSLSPIATYFASVLRSPFPKPISMKSIQMRMPLIVSHTPLLYAPSIFKVKGTISNTTMADHPLTKKDTTIFLIIILERLFVLFGIALCMIIQYFGHYHLSLPM